MRIFPSGKDHPLPVKLETLPSHVRMIMEDLALNCPNPDLVEVLAGKKSFEEALDSPADVTWRTEPNDKGIRNGKTMEDNDRKRGRERV